MCDYLSLKIIETFLSGIDFVLKFLFILRLLPDFEAYKGHIEKEYFIIQLGVKSNLSKENNQASKWKVSGSQYLVILKNLFSQLSEPKNFISLKASKLIEKKKLTRFLIN